MSRPAQGTAIDDSRPRRPALRLAIPLLAALVASGCGGGFSLDRFQADESLTTGAIGDAAARPDSRASDEAAIGAAVAAWMPGVMPPDTVPWVNSNTGSTGAIVKLSDTREPGRQCRAFTATRESFDGVGRYRGRACSENGGPWKVETLEQG